MKKFKSGRFPPFILGLSTAIGSLLLNGCAVPEKSKPQISWPIAGEFTLLPGTKTTTEPAALAADMGWQDYFNDPQLRQLIGKALDNNRDLRVTAARVSQAQKLYGIEYANGFPKINASASANRAGLPDNNNSALFGIPTVNTGYQAGLGMVNWELDFWGRVQDLRDSALNQFFAADANQRAATLSLIGQLANAYVGLGRIDQQIALAERTVKNRQENLHSVKRRVDAGSAAPIDLTTAQLLLNQAKSSLNSAQQSRATQWQVLTLLVGAPLERLQEIPLNTAQWPELRAGLPSDLLKSRPDIVAAEYQLKAAQAHVDAARAAFFPTVTLTTVGGFSSNEFNKLFESGSGAWMFSPRISMPIFDGGSTQLQYDLQTLRRTESVAQYEKAIQLAFRDVNEALSNTYWLKQRLDISQADQVQQKERVRMVQRRYQTGAANYLEVLDALRDQLQAEQELIQARAAVAGSRVNLYTALGGGSASIAAPVTAASSLTPSAH